VHRCPCSNAKNPFNANWQPTCACRHPEGRIIHSKVSGCFQSFTGAQGEAFAAIRFYLATAAKHEVDALDVLAQLFRGETWMPPRTT